MKSLFLIFNHQLTQDQESDARTSLGVRRIIRLPSDLRELWGQIPPHLPELGDYLGPLRKWLASQAATGDHVLIQGDLGACHVMVRFAFEKGLIPVYATTKREMAEARQKDGSVKMTHQFRHQIFRKYGR